MHLEKLNYLAAVPRPITKSLKRIRPKPYAFLPGKVAEWEEQMAKSAFVYAAIVQADECLTAQKKADYGCAILLYSLDSGCCCNMEWLREKAAMLKALKNFDLAGGELKKLRQMMLDAEDRNDRFLTAPLPESVTGNSCTFWQTAGVHPLDLPGGKLPEAGILPALLIPATTGGFVVEDHYDIHFIPPAMYR